MALVLWPFVFLDLPRDIRRNNAIIVIIMMKSTNLCNSVYRVHLDVFCFLMYQVAISVENMISQTIAAPDDPRRKHLEHMEKLKVIIDQKARTQVRGELYCGLGFLIIQTLGFMRLTFWELNWDVMEPICFFVTSLHFAIAYGFFLRTSTEPSFEGYFQQRFKAKQKKLMKIQGFDVQKYNQLRKVFYPNLGYALPQSEYYKPGHH